MKLEFILKIRSSSDPRLKAIGHGGLRFVQAWIAYLISLPVLACFCAINLECVSFVDMKRIAKSSLILLCSGKTNGVCVSPGGRFPPFSSEGKPPRKVNKGPKDLTLCRLFRKKTCCDVTQTHQVLLSIRRLASVGEANQECLQLWELLECSICDPVVGVRPGPPLVCSSFCDKIFSSCSNAYFSMDAKTQVLSPCGVSDFVCGRASEWVSNGTELCSHAGFSVKSSEFSHPGMEEPSCYGGKASLDSIADSWKSSQSRVTQETNLGLFEDFEQWVKEMPFSETVLWAVGGLVLTSGLFFMSKRKSNNRRQKQVAVLRTAKRVEVYMNKQSSLTQANRRGVGR
ncbi:hypothetical protein IFM89_014357 [Coptis chinensis]|uniref:Folate receptor-like domain-containing protein n=1 Tax=Coptis chinensis TaxID=261450 RepID=A0A835M5T7_9MAGN|nr:hypothetical protein IFM89_014357 [Coptis chinensis]